jgi:hypothetical protein
LIDRFGKDALSGFRHIGIFLRAQECIAWHALFFFYGSVFSFFSVAVFLGSGMLGSFWERGR